MKRKLSQDEKKLFKRIARILWKDWDPIGVYNEEDEWDNEYDGYVPSIFRLAIENRDVYKISAHLIELQKNSMGLETQENNEIDKKIAELIIKAKQEIIGNE